jgi:hypothetical protein
MVENKGGGETVDKNERRWLILRTRVYEENIKTAFRMFRDRGIEPILIKGWAAALNYPEKHRRVFGDIDLCVAPEAYEAALKVVAEPETKRLNIDLHNSLRQLDTLASQDLFENTRTVLLDDTEIRVLRPEDHLRVLCVHWLTDGGAYQERLLDIFYLLQNRTDDFAWERCLGKISPTRREWIIKTIGIVHQYYGLDISGMPFEAEAVSIPDWLIETLEKEWKSETRLVPIHTQLGNRKEFWKQIKKRLPPNAIQATVDMEGRFDDSPRFYYQLGSLFLRLKPSIGRVYNALKIFLRRKN